jgi:hypothetical protein
MKRLSTLSVGIALGVTLALLSMLCALTFALWPDATLDFFGAFSHGLDFGTIKSAAPISPGRALYGIVGLQRRRHRASVKVIPMQQQAIPKLSSNHQWKEPTP